MTASSDDDAPPLAAKDRSLLGREEKGGDFSTGLLMLIPCLCRYRRSRWMIDLRKFYQVRLGIVSCVWGRRCQSVSQSVRFLCL